jgi:tetratricopeptide (TPR) repeat protein
MVCLWGLKEGRMLERAAGMALASGAAEEDVYNARGAAEMRAGRVGRAYRWFGLALEARPGYAPALFNRAICGARLHLDGAALADVAAYLGRNPHDAAALRLAAALLCQKSREGEALALLEREVAAGGDRRLCLDAAELAAGMGAMETALRHLDAAAEGGVALGAVAQVYKGPLFDTVRGAEEGRAFTRRLASLARSKEGVGK